MKDVEKKSNSDAGIRAFIETMKINRMYELPDNSNFKWAMIEHNEFGYCWTMGYKGMCTTVFPTEVGNEIKYWRSEEEAKSDLFTKICSVNSSNFS
jgi:hypothetical protein